MRFTCVHCGKRYVTNDVLQPGRVYQTKCKSCGTPITLRGGDESAGTATSEVSVSVSRPSSAAVRPTPPGAIASPGPTAAARPSSPAVAPPPAAPAEQRYIDLFEGEGVEESVAPPASTAARATPRPATPPRGSVPSPPTSPGFRSPEPDPFSVAMQAETEPTPRPASAPLATRPPTALVAPPIAEPPPPPRRGTGLLFLGIAAGAVLAVLVVVAIWRPWMPATPTGARPSTAPATPPASASAQPAPSGTTTPPPAVNVPPQPSATDRARQEQEQQAAAARVEQERLLAEKAEKERQAQADKAARAEKERAAKAEKDRLKAERAEKERQAREERARAKAERAEKERLAKEERARAERERREKEKVAKVEAPPAPAGLPPEAVQTALAASKEGFEACFRDHADGPPVEASQVAVRFLVQPTGAVTAPEVSDQAVAASPAGQCLKSVAASLKFPAFRGDPARVEAPVAVPQVPRGGRLVAVQFTGFHSARGGGDVGDTVYSEKAADASINERTFDDGMVTYAGQVGLGEGSQYAGIGINVNMYPGPKAIDATRFKSMTIRLAASGTSTLRVRIIGADDSVRTGGCYPVKMQRVSATPKDYVLDFSDFAAESWCGSRARSTASTLKELVGFEVADIAVQRKPVTLSVGTIVLNP